MELLSNGWEGSWGRICRGSCDDFSLRRGSAVALADLSPCCSWSSDSDSLQLLPLQGHSRAEEEGEEVLQGPLDLIWSFWS